jgi:hypothetical protein
VKKIERARKPPGHMRPSNALPDIFTLKALVKAARNNAEKIAKESRYAVFEKNAMMPISSAQLRT